MMISRADVATGALTVSIPKGATSLIGFQVITPAANHQKAILSTVLSDSFSKATSGQCKGVIAFSGDHFFRRGDFPVLEGESLVVSCDTSGTALLYFDDTTD